MQGKASDTDNLHTGMTYLFIYFDSPNIRPTCSIQYFVYWLDIYAILYYSLGHGIMQ